VLASLLASIVDHDPDADPDPHHFGNLDPVLRIQDVYPGSRILIFTHPGSRIPDIGSRIQKQQQKREVKKK
jgi:hypothetical protein